MIKKYKNYIIFTVVILLLLGAYFFISSLESDTGTEDTPIKETITLVDIESDSITSVKIKNVSGEYTVVFGEAPTIKEKPGIDIDEDLLNNLKAEFSIITAESIVKENAENLTDYGLDNPEISAAVTYGKGETYTIYLGNESPVKNGYYMKKDNENTVYVLPSYKSKVLLNSLDIYRNTVLMEINADDITGISYEKRGGNYVAFEKNSSKDSDTSHNQFTVFNMTTPYKWGAEGSEVSKIINALSELQIEKYVDDNPKDITGYGFNPYYAKINISQDKGKDYELLIGNGVDEKFYIMLKGNPAIYMVSSAGFSFFDVEPKAYLQLFAYIKNIDTVKKIVYNHPGVIKSEFEISKIKDEKHDVKKDGKNVSEATFKEMYTELISMTIGGSINYKANKAPVLIYEFYFTDGTKETVNYYDYDERKVALEIDGQIQFYVNKAEFESRVNKVDEIIKNKF